VDRPLLPHPPQQLHHHRASQLLTPKVFHNFITITVNTSIEEKVQIDPIHKAERKQFVIYRFITVLLLTNSSKNVDETLDAEELHPCTAPSQTSQHPQNLILLSALFYILPWHMLQVAVAN